MARLDLAPGQQLTIESKDQDELSEYFSRRVSKVSFSATEKSRTLAVTATVAEVGQTVAVKVAMPTGARLDQGEDLDGYFLQFPISGQARWIRKDSEFAFDPAVGFVGRLYEGDVMECSDNWSQFSLRISSAQMTRCLSQLLDRPIVVPLEFAPTFDMTTNSAKTMLSQVLLASTPLGGEAFLSSSPAASAQFSDCMAMFILENFRHNYSNALSGGAGDLLPKRLKRAIDFMRANAGHAMTLEEISAAACTSPRTLLYNFKQFLGLSPFEYLRQIRLEAAYGELTSAPERVSISDIARKWGFPNAGRFAQHFKRCYGFSPSEVRRSG